jgi:tetratricopeptide (TPR) repeat protein
MKKLYSRNRLRTALSIAVILCLSTAARAQRPTEAELQQLSSVLPLVQQKNWTAAEAKLQEGLTAFPHSALLSNALGIVYEQENRKPEAIGAFEHAAEWLPNFTAAQLHLASLYADTGSCGRATPLFVAAAANTADAGALSTAGLGLAQCKNYADAVLVLEKARSSNPSPAVIFNLALAQYQTGQFEAALSTLDTLPAGAAQEGAEVFYLRGKLLESLTKPGSAISLAQACRLRPQDDYCNDAAIELIRAEQFTEAANLVEAAIHASPGLTAQLSCALGLAQFRLGRYRQAIDTYSKAISLDPHLDAAREGLGFLLYMTGDLDAARAVVERGLARPDVDFYLPYLRALVLYRTSNTLWPEARKSLAQSIRSNPNFAPSYFLRGKIALETGDDKAALSDFQTAAKLDPKYPLPYYKLAQLYLRQGGRGEAEQARKQFANLGNQREEELLSRQAQALLLEGARR